MKIDDKSLDKYLVKNLKPLTTADPAILAKYVAALLKKEKSVKEQRNVCAENLVVFLGQNTESFVAKLFEALDNGSIITHPESFVAIKQVDLSQSLTTKDSSKWTSSRKRGCSPCHWSDFEEKEASDDDDDNRNHKRRRRKARSQMAPDGTTPGLFAGRGSQTFIPGITNGSQDAVHPLCSQETLGSPTGQPLGIGMPHKRCRDFEERGFCLRGDTCPMEHGANRIIVTDVQSLSQLDLPVSVPSANLLGVQAGMEPLASAPSNLSTHGKSLYGKSSKPRMTENRLSNRLLSAYTGPSEDDIYDPDEPFWNNNHPKTFDAFIGAAGLNVEENTPLWNIDTSSCHICKLPDDSDGQCVHRSIDSAVCRPSKRLSVWERIQYPGNVDVSVNVGCPVMSKGSPRNETEDQEILSTTPGITHQKKRIGIALNDSPKAIISSSANSKLQSGSARKHGRSQIRTLYVSNIPSQKNKIEALLSHFRKFGVVVDIYIPFDCSKAYVQFSKREEAEAALKAPDAVMDNRFINLNWAHQDTIIGNGETRLLPQLSVVDRKEEDLPSITQKVNKAPSFNIHRPAAVCPKPVVITHLKPASSSEKKLESLEILKEELRLKQEMLNQKWNDYRRQINRLEKQVAKGNGKEPAEQAVKRHKMGTVSEPATLRPPNPVDSEYQQGYKRTLDKTCPGKNIVSPSTKVKSSTLLPRSSKQRNCSPASTGTPFLSNMYKLDNRPATFKVLPPLPADFANVVVLKEHFSAFGDLSAVELENLEAHAKPSETSCACITFTSRDAAERAFVIGKCWQGHNLQFSWLTASRTSIDDHHGSQENSPTPTLKDYSDDEALAETVAPRSSLSSSSMRRSTCSVSQATTSTSSTEAGNAEDGGLEPMSNTENCASTLKDYSDDEALAETVAPRSSLSSSSMRRSTCSVSQATTSTSSTEAGNAEDGGLEPMSNTENCASSHATSLFKPLSPKADSPIPEDALIVNFVG